MEKAGFEEMSKRQVEEEEEVVLPGFRFHPTDEELVGFYLQRKVEKKPLSIDIIKQIDIYKYDPWELPKLSSIGEKEWYFYSQRGRKYRNSVRPNRVTCSGFWKATGIDRPIYSCCNNTGDCIGLKKSLVYYRGSAGKGTKTDWMMHEFRLPSCNKTSINEDESWTICRIFKRNVSFKKYTQQINNLKEGGGIGQENPAESCSKTSSFESDGGEEHRYLQGGCSFQQGEGYVNRYMEENGQLINTTAQWNSNVLTNTVALQSNFGNLNEKDVLKEGNWDELGRIVDNTMEPASTYDCIYY